MGSALCAAWPTLPAKMRMNSSNWRLGSPVQVTIAVYPLEASNQALAYLKHSLINGEAVLQIA